jgi:Lon protease-like protein
VIPTPCPLFPLRLVLLPGAVVPLHIFEPRYRALIHDQTTGVAADHRFGLIAPPADTAEADLPAGRIGCVAKITSVELLPDGRSNIVVEGEARFRFETWVETGTPYRMAHIVAWEDARVDAQALRVAAAQVRELATRAIRSTMTIHDATGEPPEFEAEDAALSFQIAHLLQLGDESRYALLSERNPLTRLARLNVLLQSGLTEMETASELHTRAKTNGHHHEPPPS